MSTMGTFDAFTSARLGIYAAQHGFRVTGNNISNINTVGYTRQRLDQVSFKAGAYDQYRSELDNHVGSGALVMNINQVRDPYLDVRYRNTAADVGYNDTKLSGLQSIADILDEVGVGDDTNVNKKGDGRLQAQIQAISDALRKYADEPTSANDDLVRKAAESFCSILNSYANKLESFRKETEYDFTDKLKEINECLTNIRDLNEEIRDNEIFGDNALELRDERNRQIDALSELIHIKVVYSEEDVGAGKKVEKLSIYLDNDNPDKTVYTDEALLVDGIFGAQLSSPEKLPAGNPAFNPNSTDVNDIGSYRYLTQKLDNGVPVYNVDGVHTPIADPADVPEGATPVVDKDSGTNDITKAVMVDNDNYGIQISQLVDQRDRLWEGINATWTDVTIETPIQAIYQFKLSSSLDTGDTFEIAGKQFIVGAADPARPDATPVDLDIVQDPDEFAKLVADNLTSTDYTISASTDGSGTVIFTAINPGKVGTTLDNTPDDQQPPQTPPELTAKNGEGKISVVSKKCVNPGVTYDPPAGVDISKTTTVDNPNGTQTITRYQQNDGRWYEITSIKHLTYALTLDDNDLYGSLQAVRELLTEAGEFSTKETVDNVDEYATIKRGIPYYQNALDLLARTFAEEYNKLNNDTDENGQYKYVDETGKPLDPDKIVDGKYIMTKELPTMKEEDGKIYLLDETTGDYAEQEDWSLNQDPDFEYCVKDGFFVGTHGDENGNGCDIFEKLKVPVDDNIGEICTALQGMDDYKDALAGITVAPDGSLSADDAAKVKEVLTECLNKHGVKPGDTSAVVTKEVELPKGGVLFSNCNDRDDTDGITAANISVSNSWSNRSVQLVPTYQILWGGDVQHTTQNTNADHMVTLIDTANKIVFDPTKLVEGTECTNLFTGSFNGFYNDICTTLGEDMKETNVALNMHYTQLIEIDTSRDGVSGVDLNDEAMNLMQFQKAYSAACRLMTVVDEALDRLINNTAI